MHPLSQIIHSIPVIFLCEQEFSGLNLIDTQHFIRKS